MKTGSTSEEATYVDSGKWAGRVAFLDGNDVLVTGAADAGSEVKGKGLCKDLPGNGKAIGHLKCPTKATQIAFAFTATGGWHPRGLAFIAGANEFVFNDYVPGNAQGPASYPLVFTNEDGVALRTVPIQFKDGVVADHFEGLDYLPPTHPTFPNRLAAMMFQQTNPDLPVLMIGIITLDGVVEHHIPIAHEAFFDGAGALAVLGDDRFLIAPYSNALYEVNFSGEIVGGPHLVEGAASVEALDFLADGTLFAADYGYGKAWRFDASLERLPDSDISFGPSLGLARNLGVMEDPASDDLLFFSWSNTVFRVPRDLSSKTALLDVQASGLGRYDLNGIEALPETNRLVVAHHNFTTPDGAFWPRALSTFAPPYDPAAFVPWFPVSGAQTGFPLRGQLIGLVYAPTTSELFLRLGRGFLENRDRLLVFGSDGTYRRTVMLPVPDFQAAAFIYPTGAEGSGALLIVSLGRADVVTLDGTLLETHEFPNTTYLSDVVQDESDPSGRTFIGVSAEPSEAIRFRLP